MWININYCRFTLKSSVYASLKQIYVKVASSTVTVTDGSAKASSWSWSYDDIGKPASMLTRRVREYSRDKPAQKTRIIARK